MLLEEIWIMEDTGIVLYHKGNSSKIDDQLFGGLMSAFIRFSETLDQEGLRNLDLNNRKIMILKKDRYLFVASSQPNASNKKIRKQLEEIAQSFLTMYCLILENWDGDMGIFKTFNQEFVNITKVNPSTFMELV